jgi:serine/threonine protein kinase
MITEYMDGGSLFDLLHTKKQKLMEDQMLQISEEIAKGMAYLHGRGVVHCDLKSSNILVRRPRLVLSS